MSLADVAKEWLMARRVIAQAAVDAKIPSDPYTFAECVLARLAQHEPPLLIESYEDAERSSDAN